jgi:type IV pilus assembly protein PilC
MSSFRYTAKDKTGQSVTAVLEAPDEKTVIDSLKKQGMIPISVKAEKAAGPTKASAKGAKVKLSELVLFSRQLATMIESGIPLMQALEILEEQIENKGFKAVVGQVKDSVASGFSLYESLAKHPNAFSPLFIHMVKAGESSGALDDIMERLAGYLEKTDHLVRKVKAAMVYPAVVTTMAVVITLVLMIKVVPVFKSMFQDFGGELPMPTQILINVSDLLIGTFYIWITALVVGFFLLRRFVRTEKGTLMLDAFKLNMPVFGTLFRKVAVSKFSRTLATLIKSGVPILAALEIVGKTSGNKVIENAISKVRVSIREGENITDPLFKSKVFPPLVVRMISVGEQTGELEKMLSKIADFYDDQVDAAVSGITSLIEPLVIAFLGIVIGGIVICMFLPIFKISTLVQ